MRGGIDCTSYLAYYEYYHALMEATLLICCIPAITSVSLPCTTDGTLNVRVTSAIEPSEFHGLAKSPTELRKDQVFWRTAHSILY